MPMVTRHSTAYQICLAVEVGNIKKVQVALSLGSVGHWYAQPDIKSEHR